MAQEHHPVHRKKFNPNNAIEGIGVVIVAILGLTMLVGLLMGSGKVPW
jgi:hypothetical protein